jgi:uncharacterized protein YjbJ (UPF0337 family)
MPAPKDYIKIQYPRQCEHCDYVSNNPQMYHYHKRIHEPIPNGQLCNHGCGFPAQYRGTGGIYSCQQVSQHCPGYIKQHSGRVKQQWINATGRKEKTKESFVKRLHNVETVEKIKQTKREKSGLLTPELARDYRHYARAIRQQAQRWAKKQGYALGQQTYHVDHKFSILDSWNAKLPARVVNHPFNLRILAAKENSSKSSKSIISLDELMEAFNPSDAQA